MEGQDVSTTDGSLLLNSTIINASQGPINATDGSYFRGFPGRNSPYTTVQVSGGDVASQG
jgi:hypothetical protein